jgi:predicted dehydrogenase
MISQSRRYYASLERYREAIAEIGGAGVLTTEFFRGPHFGGFREEMAHPLLVDMAVHAFDAARYLLGADPVSVWCEAWNPSWSWFDGDAAACSVFRFDDGTRYQYTGSWVAGGLETSWNGVWRASGPDGTATWDGEHRVRSSARGDADLAPGAAEEIAGALAEFVSAVRSGEEPSGAIGRNIRSLAMVEAAVESAETGRRVEIADLLARARASAIERAPRQDLRAALAAMAATASSSA